MASTPPPSMPSTSRETATQKVLNKNPDLKKASEQILNNPNPKVSGPLKERLLREQMAALHPPASLEYVAPTLLPLPSAPVLAPAPDPENPIRLMSQLDMETAFIHDGRIGLRKMVYEIARRESALNAMNGQSLGGDSSWDKILRDEETGKNHVYHLLMTCKDEFLLSMIRGTLCFDIFHDRVVRDFVIRRRAWDGPAIYANCTALGGLTSSPATIGPHRGRWLSKVQIDKLLTEVETYIADSLDDRQHNEAIDEFFKSGWNDRSSRRYCPNNDVKAQFRVWISKIREQYCIGLDPSKNTVPFKRSPMEIGWASHVSERLKQQKKNGSTTHIHGLLNVLTRMLFNFATPHQFVIFPVWEPKEIPQIAEIVATILCNAYWYNGGLNHFRAGGFNDKIIEPKHKSGWQYSAKLAVEVYKTNLGVDLARNTTRRIQAEIGGQLDAKKAEYEAIKEEHARKVQALQELRNQRANCRFETAQQLRDDVETPLQKQLMDISTDAKMQAEVSDRVEEQLKMPELQLTEDPRFADLVEKRLLECREIVRQQAPSVFRDRDTEPELEIPRLELDDDSMGEDIDQVSDNEVLDYQTDPEEEDGGGIGPSLG